MDIELSKCYNKPPGIMGKMYHNDFKISEAPFTEQRPLTAKEQSWMYCIQ